METSVLDHVQNDDFVEFSKAIKQELFNKIYKHDYVKAKSNEVKKYDTASSEYKTISSKLSDDIE